MSETQLREAYALMKQGDKQGAARLVQSVLKEDRSNVNAWWLFSNVLDDEEKIVKSLEKVLALNPEHPGARKKLASLRPEYAHLAPSPDASLEKEKAKLANAKVYAAPKARKSKGVASMLIDSLSGLGMRGLITIIVFIPLAIAGYFASKEKEETLPDMNGDTPQVVAERFYHAMYKEDADTLYELTCPARDARIQEIIDNFSGLPSDEIILDLSATEFYLGHYTGVDKAYVSIHGSMTADYAGTSLSVDWDADAEAGGYDFYVLFFERIDNVWMVCNEYNAPNLEYTDE